MSAKFLLIDWKKYFNWNANIVWEFLTLNINQSICFQTSPFKDNLKLVYVIALNALCMRIGHMWSYRNWNDYSASTSGVRAIFCKYVHQYLSAPLPCLRSFSIAIVSRIRARWLQGQHALFITSNEKHDSAVTRTLPENYTCNCFYTKFDCHSMSQFIKDFYAW